MKVLIHYLMICILRSTEGTIVKYLKVFQDIFKHTENIGHYNMMMGIDSESE